MAKKRDPKGGRAAATWLVLATADAGFERRVREAFGEDPGSGVCYWREDLPLGADIARTLADVASSGAEVVALGPDIPVRVAVQLAHTFDQQHPQISVVIVAAPSPNLMRAALQSGARDVIAPDADLAELRSSLEHALVAARARRARLDGGAEAEESPKRVVTVLCPKGGAGKTTVATNIAAGLAQIAPQDVVVVDLDLQFGDVGAAMGLEPEQTFSDVVKLGAALDASTLKACLTPHPDGLFALCAPGLPSDADSIGTAHVEAVLALLVESFTYVVIDTAAGLDEVALAALEFSTDFVVLSATDVPSVRNTRKEIDALRVLARPEQRWHFVLNRADARTGLKLAAIEMAVGVTVDVAIPSSRSVPVSLNGGVSLLLTDPRAPVSLAMAQLVRRLLPRHASASAARNGSSNRRKKQMVAA